MKKNQGSAIVDFLIVFSVLFVICGSIIGCSVGQINSMRIQDEVVNSAWAQVDNQLQRRFDLIPNLVNTVKGYATHESKVLEGVAQARAAVGQAKADPSGSLEKRVQAEGELTQALGRLIMVTENYPQLKADKHFTQLMDELAGTENRIATARMDYNGTAKTQNATIRTFPGCFFVGLAGVQKRTYFETSAEARKNVAVQF